MKRQHLAAIFELRPTRRKAAALERVRAAAEVAFWHALDAHHTQAEAVAAEPDAAIRRGRWRAVQAAIRAAKLAACSRAGLAEPVAQGVGRDVEAAIGSYVGLRAAGHAAEWPAPADAAAADHAGALALLAGATTRPQENGVGPGVRLRRPATDNRR